MEFQREFHSNRRIIFAVLLALLAVGTVFDSFRGGECEGGDDNGGRQRTTIHNLKLDFRI